jgi:membrane protease subunit HflC
MNRFPLVLGGVIAALALILALSSMFQVHQSQQALVIQFGDPLRRVDQPGLYFKLPLIQEVVYFDKRVLDFDARPEEVPTLDQKQLVVDAFARFVIVDPLKFFQTVNNEQGIQSRLATIISSNLRRVLGEVQMSRVLTEERASLMHNIRESVNREAAGFGVDVIDVRIRRVDLPEENSQAIFARMKTQREQEARRRRSCAPKPTSSSGSSSPRRAAARRSCAAKAMRAPPRSMPKPTGATPSSSISGARCRP